MSLHSWMRGIRPCNNSLSQDLQVEHLQSTSHLSTTLATLDQTPAPYLAQDGKGNAEVVYNLKP